MKKTAILYDFDKTLCTKDMQEYSLIPSLGYKEPSQFWKEVGKLSRQSQMDGVSAYLYWLVRKYEEQGRPLRREDFADVGRSIEFYRGVDTWFSRINEYGASLGLEIEHYVISSGMAEIIEASGIRKIYVNGKKAEQMYKKYQEPVLGIKATCLPSTSPANAAWGIDRLVNAWSIIK
jgi:2-hydroxy-3-keto-5-methylthiopentenyl-1-phosphate phosphatase